MYMWSCWAGPVYLCGVKITNNWIIILFPQGRPTEATGSGAKTVAEFGALEAAEMVPGLEVSCPGDQS